VLRVQTFLFIKRIKRKLISSNLAKDLRSIRFAEKQLKAMIEIMLFIHKAVRSTKKHNSSREEENLMASLTT